MFFSHEFLDRTIVDTNKPHATFDQKLCAFGFEINKILVKLTIVPVLRVFRLEEDSLDTVPLQRLELSLSDRANARDFKNSRFSDEAIQRNFVQPLAILDEMIGSVDVSSHMRADLNDRLMNGVGLISSKMGCRLQSDGRPARPDRQVVRKLHADVVNHSEFKLPV